MTDSKYRPTPCVGADVHLDEIVLRAVDKALGHEVIERFRVTNNLPGAQVTATTTAQTASEFGYARIEIGWESTGMLWIPFHRYLSTEPLLQPFELELICFNPKLSQDQMGASLAFPMYHSHGVWENPDDRPVPGQ